MLTHAGLKRLQAAIAAVEIAENNGDRFTLEELGDRIRVSTKTLSRLWSLNSGLDRKTLHLCFSSFNLDLQPGDYVVVGDLAEPEAPVNEPDSLSATQLPGAETEQPPETAPRSPSSAHSQQPSK
ncbi:hypothetical protein [Leptolyngbya sp. O-77]|uniref:hypothetical protein n=1 Tax=Leptolyngbya sp. O-77 TaxID=1080068 RepID=UPI00074D3E8C|nr:hypothetical protein [Leptolyngbya sp. O-77]BAU44074.1 hypothetical protein O77CONTIG1_03909 [Leptolyngbya sp. O-77]